MPSKPYKQVNIRPTDELRDRLHAEAKSSGRSISVVACTGIEVYLDALERQRAREETFRLEAVDELSGAAV